jgi:hypothetical protein
MAKQPDNTPASAVDDPVRCKKLGTDVMREYDDYDDDHIRLYTPVVQRVVILAAVVIAVPIVMWTITTFVRSYVARPKVPALEHVASMNTRVPAIAAASPNPVPPPANQSAIPQADAAPTGDGPGPAVELRKTSLPDASLSSTAASGSSGAPSAITATTTGDVSAGNSTTAAIPPAPRVPQSPRSADNVASASTPSSSDRGIAWPNPNATSAPDFGASRLPPPPPPPRMAAAEVVPAEEPIRGPIPLPRHRPSILAMIASSPAASNPAASSPGVSSPAASGAVPLPRIRPSDAPAEAANSVIEPAYGYRPGLDSDR